tara:strand:+ start:598 stop:786 length:189 start_codon:yes stop_codon:yes gene_type:complete
VKKEILRDYIKKLDQEKLKNFTGIDSDYEKPNSPEITLDTKTKNAEDLADEILLYLKNNNKI